MKYRKNQTNTGKTRHFGLFSVLSIGISIFLTTYLSSQTLIEPRPFSVIKSGPVRLVAEIPQSKKASSVLFYAVHGIHTKNDLDTMLIGTTDHQPYAILWDASSLPDLDMNRLFLYCDFIDDKGLLFSGKDFAVEARLFLTGMTLIFRESPLPAI